MANIDACLSVEVARDTAVAMLDKIKKDNNKLYESLSIDESNKDDEVIPALERLVQAFWANRKRDNAALEDVKGFTEYLEKNTQSIVSSQDYVLFKKVLEHVLGFLSSKVYRCPRLSYTEDHVEFEDGGTMSTRDYLYSVVVDALKEDEIKALNTSNLTADVVFDTIINVDDSLPKNKKTGETHIIVIFKEPVAGKESAQDKTISKLRNLISREPANFGGRWYLGGIPLKTEAVTRRVYKKDPSNTVFPTIASFTGDQVDDVFREYFDDNSKFFTEEGELVDDNKFATIIKNDLGGAFSVQGLKNLIYDIMQLERLMNEKWGKYGDIKVIAQNFHMVAQNVGENEKWVIGAVDLLVVDGRGEIRVLDVKTSKVSTREKYSDPYGEADTYESGRTYTEQLYNYINMLRSYGFVVHSTPYIVMCDTYYADDFTDFGKGIENPAEGEVIGKRTSTTKAFRLTRGKTKSSRKVELEEGTEDAGKTLGEYAAEHNYVQDGENGPVSIGSPVDTLPKDVATKEEANKESARATALSQHLYLEPRLHIDLESGELSPLIEMKSLEELASTEGKSEEQIERDKELLKKISFKSQVELLDKSEQEALRSLIGGIKVKRPVKGLIPAGKTDITSKPELITKKEIKFLSETMMRELWNILNLMQKGIKVRDAVTKEKINTGKNTLGKTHSQLINEFKINKLLLVAFHNTIERRYNKAADEDSDEFKPEIFETQKELEEAIRRNQKIKHIKKHIDQFNTAGLATLLALEKTVVPVKKKEKEKGQIVESDVELDNNMLILDTGDDPSFESFVDNILEGRMEPEAWTVESNRQSVKLHLSQEVRQLFEYLDTTDASGKKVYDSYGWGITVMMNPTKAIQMVLDWCKECETEDQMDEILEGVAIYPKNKWLNSVLQTIKKDKNLKKKFIRNFRKDFNTYTAIVVKVENGKRILSTKVVNLKSSYDEMMSRLSNTFRSGHLGTVKIEDGDNIEYLQIMDTDEDGNNRLQKFGRKYVISYLQDDIESIIGDIKGMYSAAVAEFTAANMAGKITKSEAESKKDKKFRYIAHSVRQKLIEKDKDNVSTISQINTILQKLGIDMPEQALINYCLSNVGAGFAGSSTSHLFNSLNNIIGKLISQDEAYEKGTEKAVPIPSGLSKLKAFRDYAPLIENLSAFVPESVEASCYEAGKNYFSYTNPSRLKHTIRQLKCAHGDEEEFKQYIYDNFKRYEGWFVDKNGVWYNNLLERLTSGNEIERDKARKALAYKEELAFLGTQYRELGPLAFQLSILHNYYGSRNDRHIDENCRWYAVPTMSNKPVNAFIRMLKYKSYDTSTGESTEIVNKVLMPTFKQEINRIVDVLHHYVYHSFAQDNMDITDKNLERDGWTEEEINTLKAHIQNRVKYNSEDPKSGITVEELRRLAEIKSGAKFHFLWYLNREIKENDAFAERIVNRINNLLIPDDRMGDYKVNRTQENETNKEVRKVIVKYMEIIVKDELDRMEEIGLFDTKEVREGKVIKQVPKYAEGFDGKLGYTVDDMKKNLKDFIWQDVAANINIIQITGGDLANYGTPDNYQKRIAQEHAPGIPLVHDEDYDDGYIRSVYISDTEAVGEVIHNARAYLEERAKTWPEENERAFRMLKNDIIEALEEINETDGQSFTSITGIRKKLADQGEWTREHDIAYDRIKSGKFDLHDLSILIQPAKPIVVADMAKLSNSPTMAVRKVTAQMKNSEYLILLADALSIASGKRSKITAIHNFLEKTAEGDNVKSGIDTVHFVSVGKNGVTGCIDLNVFDEEFNRLLAEQDNYEGILDKILDSYHKEDGKKITDADYSPLMTEYMMMHIRRYNSDEPNIQDKQDYDKEEDLSREKKVGLITKAPVFKNEELLYNSQYVDTVPISSYIIQQPVPEHDFGMGMKYGSQVRILGITDITPGTIFKDTNGEDLSDVDLIEEFEQLHAENIKATAEELLKEFGLDKLIVYDGKKMVIKDIDNIDPIERDEIFFNLEFLLQKELMRDLHYSLDLKKACTLTFDDEGHVDNFLVPLYEPAQSNRVQMLINSIIKRTVNQQKVTGSPVVQVTGFDSNLHIRFKDSEGQPLETYNEFEKKWLEGKDRKKGWKEKCAEDFQEYLKDTNARIDAFEALVVCPNKTLEALITKEDGSLMTPEEIQKAAPKVWDEMSKIIGYRIPTESKYSILPIKIVGFLPSKSGQGIMLPSEITALTGSDFDIDKLYLMLKAFFQNTLGSMIEKEEAEAGKLEAENILERILDHLKIYNLDDDQLAIAGRVIANASAILGGDTSITLTTGVRYEKAVEEEGKTRIVPMSEDEIDKINSVIIEPIRGWLLRGAFETFNDSHLESGSPRMQKQARDNRIFDLQWLVLTHNDTALKILHSGNFNEEKRVGRITKLMRDRATKDNGELWTWEELEDRYDRVRAKERAKGAIEDLDSLIVSQRSYSITLPSSKIYFQRQNMQGTQLVGACANANVSHAFVSLQELYLDLEKNGGKAFYLFGRPLGFTENGSMTRVDPQRGSDGRLVSDVLASMLAAAVDTAKDTSLKEANIDTFTIGVATTMVRLGFSYEEVGQFLSQPVIAALSDMYFKRKVEGYYDGDKAISEMARILGIEDINDIDDIKDANSLTRENIISNISNIDYNETGKSNEKNFQIRVLKAFNILYKIAGDMRELTYCTKFNSVSNAPGPFIADVMVMQDRVDRFNKEADSDCFYSPKDRAYYIDEEGNRVRISTAQQIISNDPILAAFHDSTIGNYGVATIIFKQFFPHYYKGFQNIVDYFKKHYTRTGKMTAALYNSLLNDYMYYLLTYREEDSTGKTIIPPILPCTKKDIEELVDGLVKNHSKALAIAKKYGYNNELLNQEIGSASLYIRPADNYIKMDILNFRSGQLDREGRDKIIDEWDDLLYFNYSQSDNKEEREEENMFMRRYAIDLFFYNLMRNGFSFSPKTMMHLSSVLMKLNAHFSEDYGYYLGGLRTLKKRDAIAVGNDIDAQERFCKQYLRNHSTNTSLVPTFGDDDAVLTLHFDVENNSVETATFTIGEDNKSKLYALTMNGDRKSASKESNFCLYVSIIRRDRETKETRRELYEYADSGEEGGTVTLVYRKTQALGIPGQFVEYDASEDIEESFFENRRGEEQADEDVDTQEDTRDPAETDEIIVNRIGYKVVDTVTAALEDAGIKVTEKNKKALKSFGKNTVKDKRLVENFEKKLKEVFGDNYTEEVSAKVKPILEEFC